MPSDILDALTEAQREAVTHMDGPMLVVAGAGSGKTRVVTRRIAHLVSRGVWPEQILALTFTNKAANEMKRRVEELVGVLPRWVGTFHSACARLLRRDLARLEDGRTGSFTIYDTTDQKGIVRMCLRDLRLEKSGLKPGDLLGDISRAKCSMTPPDELPADTGNAFLPRVYAAYEARLRRLNAVDFDDLLLLTVRLLEHDAALRDVYHSRFRYLLVDEYQDTNHLQYRLMKLLTGPGRNVHATGDPDQSIYSWRGADYTNIMAFTEDFPDARVVRLEQNYRSTKIILHAANQLIRFNETRIDKELFTDNPEGSAVMVVEADSDRSEASWVVEHALQQVHDGRSLREMAVFYRTNAQSRPLEEALMRAGIPYQIVGGIRFYERKEIKDILSHLHLMVNARDLVALQRVTDCRPTGVGIKTLAAIVDQCAETGLAPGRFLASKSFTTDFKGRCTRKLAAFAAWCRDLMALPTQPVGDAIYETIQHSGLIEHIKGRRQRDPSADDRLGNLNGLIDRGYEFQEQRPDATLRDFLEEVALISDVDTHDPKADRLALMTLHSSKGLEFPVVFLVGAEEGYLPHTNSLASPESVEEERRLFYVGMTRAQRHLVISHAQRRFMWREVEWRRPSRFLTELPEEAVRVAGAPRQWEQPAAESSGWTKWYDPDLE